MNGKNAKAMRREGNRAIQLTAQAVGPALQKVAEFAKSTETTLGDRIAALETLNERGWKGFKRRARWFFMGER